MSPAPDPTRPAPPVLTGALVAVFQVGLLLYLLLAPSVHCHLHRYGTTAMLIGVSQLLALWVTTSLLGFPLRYGRTAVNVLLWLVLMGLFLHVAPLPQWGPVGQTPDIVGEGRPLLTNNGYLGGVVGGRDVPFGRLSLLPGMATGVLVLAASVAGLYWLLASAVVGRKQLRRATWALLLGLTLLAVWHLAQGRTPSEGETPTHVPILGGDSLVPAMLAGLPLAVALALRPIGFMPHRPRARRQSRLGWLLRPGTIAAGGALVAGGLMAVALGASHVAPWQLILAVGVAVTAVLAGYLAGPSAGLSRKRMAVLAVVIAAWLGAMAAVGSMVRPPLRPAASAPLGDLRGISTVRDAVGLGPGAVSPVDTYGRPGWPTGDRQDGDTSGYSVLLAETGWIGLTLAVALVVAMAGRLIVDARGGRSPLTRMLPVAGLGALAANMLYFGVDASALLAPNLWALAGVLGLVVAWGLHGDRRREARRRFGYAHWPFVIAAVGIAAALGVAENDMLTTAGAAFDLSDKLLHAGMFGVICLLLCYAMSPKPSRRFVTLRILGAIAFSGAMGVALELGQRYMTGTRSAESTEMVADVVADLLGALAVGIFWWVLQKGGAQHAERDLAA